MSYRRLKKLVSEPCNTNLNLIQIVYKVLTFILLYSFPRSSVEAEILELRKETTVEWVFQDLLVLPFDSILR